MKTITLCAFKGGTGKTATSIHLGAALAKFHDKRVLIVDFDSQANLSSGLGFGTDRMETMVPVLQKQLPISKVIHHTKMKNLDVIPANTYLDQIESTEALVRDPYAHERLRESLNKVSHQYDFAIIDIPASLGWLCRSAFYAAQYSLVCAVAEPYSVLGLQRLAKYHEFINEKHALGVLGVLFCFWDERLAANKVHIEGIDLAFPGKGLNTKIRKDVSLAKAIPYGLPVFETETNSRASEDYQSLAKEILTKI